jgi:hypothetical protein
MPPILQRQGVCSSRHGAQRLKTRGASLMGGARGAKRWGWRCGEHIPGASRRD